MYWGECPVHDVQQCVMAVEEVDGKAKPVYRCIAANEDGADCNEVVTKVKFINYQDTSTVADEERHCDTRCLAGTINCNCKCGGMCHGRGRCVCGQ